MYLTDLHTHTCCSPDSHAFLKDMALAASAAGLRELCTTDHCDLLDGETGVPTLHWDWAPVLAQYRSALADCPPGLELRLGLELGSAQFFPKEARAILEVAPLDLVIGSAHSVSPALGGRDFYFLPYETEEEAVTALDDYFDSLLQIARLDLCDVLGHIIYPLRYINGRAGHHITLAPWWDRLEKILTAVIRTGKSIEVNTHCGQEVEPWRPILRLYRDLGGERVTLSSDAHDPGDVGAGIRQAARLLEETGFHSLTVYRGRRPVQITFKEELL